MFLNLNIDFVDLKFISDILIIIIKLKLAIEVFQKFGKLNF